VCFLRQLTINEDGNTEDEHQFKPTKYLIRFVSYGQRLGSSDNKKK